MTSAALRSVTDQEIETFWRDGVVCLRGIVDNLMDGFEIAVFAGAYRGIVHYSASSLYFVQRMGGSI
jgi:hypothetical protein